ncbi:MAG: nuclear transport factor 2 family protein [Acidimicrobiales bacterium]
MPRTPLPPLAAVLSFIDCINRGDVEGLGNLMTADHQLVVLDESPLAGRAGNVEAWKGYVSAYPEYVIYPRHLVADEARVAVLGTTTGSHLGLPDADELKLGVIWLAEVTDGALSRWQIVEDTPLARAEAGLPLMA